MGRGMKSAVRRKAVADVPTPETAAKLKPDVLTVLHRAGYLSAEDLAAAEDISRIWRALMRGLFPQRPALDGARTAGRPGARDPISGMSTGEAWLWRAVYKPWAADMSDRVLLPAQTPGGRLRHGEISRLELVRRIVSANDDPVTIARDLAPDLSPARLAVAAERLADDLGAALMAFTAQKQAAMRARPDSDTKKHALE